MPTTTPRLGLTKPLTTEFYDVAVQNTNMDLIDAGPANLTICTSTTRPSTPDDGDGIFETDSGPNVLWRQGGSWKAGMGKAYICTSSTRPGSTLTFGGFQIYETDTGNRQIRNAANTAWLPLSPYRVADATAQAALTGLLSGFITYRVDNQQLYVYDGASHVRLPKSLAPVADVQSTQGSTNATAFTPTLTSGTACSFVFTAPPSGVVIVVNTGAITAQIVAYCYMDFEVRLGGTIGSGTLFRGPSDLTSLRHADVNYIHASRLTTVAGLTPLSTYNIRQQFRTASGTAVFQDKELLILPQP